MNNSDRHSAVLFRYAFRMTGSESAAEDLVQECFLSLLRRPGSYDPSRGAVRAFLLGIARNLILMQWRKERSYEPLEDDSSMCLPLDLIDVERSEAIAKAVQSLPSLQREVLILAEYEELSLDEIVQITNAELGAVKSRLHRARQNLRRLLAPLMESKGALYGTDRS